MTRRNWTAIASTHALEEYRERAADVDYPQDRPEEPMTDPHIMAAFLRGQANALQRAHEALCALSCSTCQRPKEIIADAMRQLREVAQREER
jgi:hypothetical protein